MDSPLSALPLGRPVPMHNSIMLIGAGENSTTNTDLAMALIACGIPLKPSKPFEIFDGEMGARVVWYFEETSEDATLRTGELIKAWDDFHGDNGWCARNPNHPFAYAAAALKNRGSAGKFIRENAPLVVVREGNCFALLREGIDRKLRDQLLTTTLRISRGGWK
jgi:hypothetical protein